MRWTTVPTHDSAAQLQFLVTPRYLKVHGVWGVQVCRHDRLRHDAHSDVGRHRLQVLSVLGCGLLGLGNQQDLQGLEAGRQNCVGYTSGEPLI